MIVATAGHIDHGKTALVGALTGIDTDRLPEEKRRGITLDLGFAYARRDGRTLGFVDVPGHERLVRTMVAGATGVDCALLAVAADDGVMPQTREHLAILDLLGIGRGLVAITKSDRADTARLAAVEAEIRQALEGTGLVGAPILACSAVTGAGIPQLAERLDALAAPPPDEAEEAHFRLAVDRCFSVPGAGLVATGAVHAGTVRAGDRLLVSPGGIEVRVRAVRSGNEAVEGARAGQRCALNLTGPRLSREAIHRGDWVLAPELHRPATRLDVSLRLLPGEARPLRHRTPVQLHLGAAMTTGRVLLGDGEAIGPGGSAHARIALDGPIGALHGDRFILRDTSASRTLGGGRVIDVDGPRRGARTPARLAMVAALAQTDHAAALSAVLPLSVAGLDLDRFARIRNLPPARMDGLGAAAGLVTVETGQGRLGFAGDRIAALRAGILAELDRLHADEPDEPGLSADEIAGRLPVRERPALRAVLDGLVGEGAVERRGPLHHRPGHVVRLGPAEATLYEEIRLVLAEAGLDQPRIADLAARVGHDPDGLRPLLDKLGRLGWLRRLSRHYYVLPDVLAELARRARASAAEHPQALLTVGRFREATGIGRNITMPVLEHFDARGLTHRIADGRLIRADAVDL